ncbi:MAG: chemotaxis protein CheW, partial [Steroidobacteraceae bacterium]
APALVQRRGETIPLFALETLLARQSMAGAPAKALIVKQSRGIVAFGVDRMLGQQEAVVRPLDDALVRVPGVTGATDLGDGRPTLVLDLARLGVSLAQGGAMS